MLVLLIHLRLVSICMVWRDTLTRVLAASPLRRRPRLASPEKVESMDALESQTSACSDDDILQGFDLEGFLSQVKGAPSPEKEAPPSKSPIRGPATLTRFSSCTDFSSS